MKKSKVFAAFAALVLLCALLYAGPSIFSVYQGGTGASSFTAHGVLIGEGSSPVIASGTSTAGQCFMSNASGSDPSFQTCGSGGGSNTPFSTPVAASPAIPYYGLMYWYSADCIYLSDGSTCATPSNGTDVAYWWDRSGIGSVAIEQTSGCTFSSSVSAINNEPAISFNGTCGKYSLENTINANWNGSGFTIFAVAQSTLTSGSGAIIGGSGNGDVEYRMNGSGHTQELLVTNTLSLGTDSSTPNTSWHQINVTCGVGALNNTGGATNPVFRIDRTSSATLSGAACNNFAGTAKMIWFGLNDSGSGSEKFTGAIAEIIVYHRVLSSTEISSVESYLHTKYGL